MKYISKAITEQLKGQSEFGPVLVLPNQALSLREILQRFTRGEPIAIGKETTYHESDDDLEKVSHLDLVDREEFVNRLKLTQKDYEKQEKLKELAQREAIRKKLEEEEAAKLKAAESAAKGADPAAKAK